MFSSSHDILGVSVKNKTHDKLVLTKQCWLLSACIWRVLTIVNMLLQKSSLCTDCLFKTGSALHVFVLLSTKTKPQAKYIK